VSDAGHGGCFLILPTDYALTDRYLGRGWTLNSMVLRQTLNERLRVEPKLAHHVHGTADIDSRFLDDAPFLERGLARAVGLVSSLAAVDGAVIVSRDLQIMAFGKEIVGVENQGVDEVRILLHPRLHEPFEVRPLESFGMRHRSAIRFCLAVPGSIAFVASQDGGVRVFTATAQRAVDGSEVVPEDWIFA